MAPDDAQLELVDAAITFPTSFCFLWPPLQGKSCCFFIPGASPEVDGWRLPRGRGEWAVSPSCSVGWLEQCPVWWLQGQAGCGRQGSDLFPHRVLSCIFFSFPHPSCHHLPLQKGTSCCKQDFPPSPTSRQDCWVFSKGSCATPAALEDIHPCIRVLLLPHHP